MPASQYLYDDDHNDDGSARRNITRSRGRGRGRFNIDSKDFELVMVT